MIYTHCKTPFHHLNDVKQPLQKSDPGPLFPASSHTVWVRPTAAPAKPVLLQATGLPHYPNNLQSL